MRRTSAPVIAILALVLVASACRSGPSPEALARNVRPSTTTTTEPPPEGVVVVQIRNGSFAPANVKLDLSEFWIVRWENVDPPRSYMIQTRRDEFTSPELAPGDTFEVDLREFEPSLIRYFSFLGQQRIPGQIDTRPDN